MKHPRSARRFRSVPLSDDPLWFKDAIIYEARVRSFKDSDGDGVGDFRGLTASLDYLEDLGVSTLWLLPFYPSPLRDDGYDISDYYEVHPDVGTLDDFKRFLEEAHRRGLRVVTELVINHTSDQHPWFQRARRAPPGSPERDFYVWSDTPEKYKGTRIIFKDFELSNWTWDPVAKAYFWHRFYSHQPDLNFENPAVQQAIFDVVDYWLGMGVDALRLDAVPYLFEQEGTNCENLPQTHEYLKKLRAHIDARFRNRMLLAEANQWPEDAAAYFGDGDECHMNFHFPIMPRLFMSIHMEDRLPIIDILAQTPEIPDNAQWALFLRNHDELTLEMVTDEERDYMYRAFAHETSMRINLGIRRRLAPLAGNNRRQIELMNGLLFSMPGTPVLYYGDEIGMGDNVYLGDRNGVRTPMQWSPDRNAGFSRANPQKLILPIVIDPEYHYESINVEAQQNNTNSLLWWTKRLIAMRQRFRAFGRGTIEFLHPDNPRVLAFLRQYEDELVLVVANLSRHTQYAELDLSPWNGRVPRELFGGTPFPAIGELPYLLTLGPHGFYWFSLERSEVQEDTAREAEYQAPTIEVVAPMETLLTSPDHQPLEMLLPAFLESRRWFAGRGREIDHVYVESVLQTGEPGSDMSLFVVRVDYVEGDPERYTLALAVATGDEAQQVRQKSLHAVVAHLRGQEDGDVPEGVLFMPLSNGVQCEGLLRLIGRGERHRTAAGEWRSEARAPMGDEAPMEVRVVRDQHESALSYDGTYFLKVRRHVSEAGSVSLEMSRFFAQHAPWAPVPAYLGALELRPTRKEPIGLALVLQFVPSESDAMEFTLEELGRYFERVLTRLRDTEPPPRPTGSLLEIGNEAPPPVVADAVGTYLEWARLLGRRTAELHRALASAPDDPAFSLEPYSAFDQRSVYQTMRNLTGRTLRTLKSHLGKLPEHERPLAQELLGRESLLYRHFEPLREGRLTAQRSRYHGDYRLENVLFTGKDFVIVGFEGDVRRALSDRRRKRSVLRDVAGMVRSMENAAATVLYGGSVVRDADRAAAEPWARLWQTWTTASFLSGYFQSLENAPFLPSRGEEMSMLLDAFVLDKALKQLSRVLEHGDEPIGLALRALSEIVGKPSGV